LKKGDQLIYQPGIWQQLVTVEHIGKESGATYIQTSGNSGYSSEFKVPTAEDLIRHQEIEVTRSVIAEIKVCYRCQIEIDQGWIIERSIEDVNGYCSYGCGTKAGISSTAFIRNAYYSTIRRNVL